MIPTDFPQANRRLGPPAGLSSEQCGTLAVLTDGQHCVSKWIPTAEDLERILAGGPVWLVVWSGATQPPVALTTEQPFVTAAEAAEAPAGGGG